MRRLDGLFLLAVVAAGCRSAPADRIEPVLDAIDERLDLGEEVARAKWNSKAPVEDRAREEQVVAAAVGRSGEFGLDPSLVESFFRAQVEASKTLQRARHEAWTREARGPFESTPDLAGRLRPALDRVGEELLAALAGAVPALRGEGGRDALEALLPAAVGDEARRAAREVAVRPLVEFAGRSAP